MRGYQRRKTVPPNKQVTELRFTERYQRDQHNGSEAQDRELGPEPQFGVQPIFLFGRRDCASFTKDAPVEINIISVGIRLDVDGLEPP